VTGGQLGKADIRSIEEHIGRGGEAGVWAMMALDPMAEADVGGCRIPDKTVGSTAAFVARNDTTISRPPGLPSDVDLWDCLILCLNMPEAPFVYFTKATKEPKWVLDNMHVLSMPTLDPAYHSYNKTAITSELGSPKLLRDAEAFRTTHKGISIMYDAPSLFDQGRAFCCQMRATPNITEKTSADTGEGLEKQICKTAEYFKIPGDQGTMYSVAPEMTRFKAKHGVYMPMRFNNVIHNYTTTSGATKAKGEQDNRMISGLIQLQYSDGTVSPSFRLSSADGPKDGSELGVSGLDNTQVGIILFKGLSELATLDVKMLEGIECQCDPAASWCNFMERVPDVDEKALEMQVTIADRLPMAYPERYNAWGALVPVIGQVLGSVLQWGVGKVTTWLSNRQRSREAEARDAQRALIKYDQTMEPLD
jgi:hypothetical protein